MSTSSKNKKKNDHLDRIFIIGATVTDVPKQRETLVTVSEKSYAAGVKQIITIEAKRIPCHSYGLNDRHLEKVIYAIPNRKYYATLRPMNFMSTVFFLCYDGTIQPEDTLIDSAGPEEKTRMDISLCYCTSGCKYFTRSNKQTRQYCCLRSCMLITTSLERTTILTTTLGRTIIYKQLPGCSPIIQAHSLSLERASETYEIWAAKNKQ
ncbi:hypothetical protein BDC45DRAFT_610163 [Circinella umbellata]|nr:hypothetical protein BDC45DRAFT_610163 [Circinella umbellata]